MAADTLESAQYRLEIIFTIAGAVIACTADIHSGLSSSPPQRTDKPKECLDERLWQLDNC